MATRPIQHVVEQIRAAVLGHDVTELGDGQLLESFVARRDETAFDLLFRRHGPMVFGVCRRILGNHHDAEDAFQATFLILARKAGSIMPRHMVGNWLYGVAYHTSLKARSIAARRQMREQAMRAATPPTVTTESLWVDLQPLLDRELNGLTDKYRTPIVMCDLEGKSSKQAAQELGVPEGTFSSRLSRGRALLAERLTRRGVTLSGTALATVLAHGAANASVPLSLAASTALAVHVAAAGHSASGLVSSDVANLVDSTLRSAALARLKKVAATLLLLAAIAGIVAFGFAAFPRSEHGAAPEKAKESKDEDKPKMRVVAEPFLWKGSYYLRLSVENPGDVAQKVTGVGSPAWTSVKSFRILADGKESTFQSRGAFAGLFSREEKTIAPKSRLFYGIALLAGKDKARMDDGYSPQFDLAAGEHEIDVRAIRIEPNARGGDPETPNPNIAPAVLKVTIPPDLDAAPDRVPPSSDTPLTFTVSAANKDADTAVVTIYLANDTTDVFHYPYRGDTSPWHRSNWYRLEIDGQAATPFRNELEHPDRPGRCEIPAMHQRYAHTLRIISEKTKGRTFDKNDYHPVYVVPPGEHVVRVIASPLWLENKTPAPVAATIRIRLGEPNDKPLP
jgi:RNA polymerase sigma factor (sigma-70 family)